MVYSLLTTILPGLGKSNYFSRQACPNRAKSNRFSGMFAQVGQAQINFQANLPKPGKEELVLGRTCPNRAKANWFCGGFAQTGQGRREIKNGSILIRKSVILHLQDNALLFVNLKCIIYKTQYTIKIVNRK